MNIIPCRKGCGACCIAPSISSPIPGMPNGKPAGIRCVCLTGENHCSLYGRDERPAVCSGYQATGEFCGSSRGEALERIKKLEAATTNP